MVSLLLQLFMLLLYAQCGISLKNDNIRVDAGKDNTGRGVQQMTGRTDNQNDDILKLFSTNEVLIYETKQLFVDDDITVQAILQSGRIHTTQIQCNHTSDSTCTNRTVVVFDVLAPITKVYRQIVDYIEYNRKEYFVSTLYFGEFNETDIIIPKQEVDDKMNKRNRNRFGTRKQPQEEQKIQQQRSNDNLFIRHIVEHKNLLQVLNDVYDYYWYFIPHPKYPHEQTRLYYSVQAELVDTTAESITNDIWKHVSYYWTSPDALAHTASCLLNANSKVTTGTTGGYEIKNCYSKYAFLLSSTLSAIKYYMSPTLNYLASATSAVETRVAKGSATNQYDHDAPGECLYDESNINNHTKTCENASLISSKNTHEKAKLGIKRHVLVLTIIVLALYNIHLFFSQ